MEKDSKRLVKTNIKITKATTSMIDKKKIISENLSIKETTVINRKNIHIESTKEVHTLSS